MMMPHELAGRLFVMHPHRPISAWTQGNRITGVVVRALESGRETLIEAPFFVDATPYGDLLELAGVEHVLGAESRSETGEPHASDTADPRDQQAITVCFAMEHLAGEDHTIEKPTQYEVWRELRPPGWPGPLLSWTTVRPETHEILTRALFEADDDRPLVAVPPNPRSRELRGGIRAQRHHRGELAAERLLVRSGRRRRSGRMRS
jgi:hypothetical protein